MGLAQNLSITSKPGRNMMQRQKSVISELKLVAFCVFYLSTNFVVFYIPFWLYFAYYGSTICRVLIMLTLLDYIIPLKTGPRGLWYSWCHWTNFSFGLQSYFDAELIVEGECRKDRNYLLMC